MTNLQAAPPSDAQALLHRLRDEHHALKARVAEIDRHVALTREEQLECARLKKLKLAAKDLIFRLEHQQLS